MNFLFLIIFNVVWASASADLSGSLEAALDSIQIAYHSYNSSYTGLFHLIVVYASTTITWYFAHY